MTLSWNLYIKQIFMAHEREPRYCVKWIEIYFYFMFHFLFHFENSFCFHVILSIHFTLTYDSTWSKNKQTKKNEYLGTCHGQALNSRGLKHSEKPLSLRIYILFKERDYMLFKRRINFLIKQVFVKHFQHTVLGIQL